MCSPLPQDQDDTCRTLPGAPARLSSGLGALQVGLWGPEGRKTAQPPSVPPSRSPVPFWPPLVLPPGACVPISGS